MKVLSLILGLLFFGNIIFADESHGKKMYEVTVTGKSFIEDNILNAKEKAIANALEKAIEQVNGTFIESKAAVENFILRERSLKKYSFGRIKSYKVISTKLKDKFCIVKLKCIVEEIQDRDWLDNLNKKINVKLVINANNEESEISGVIKNLIYKYLTSENIGIAFNDSDTEFVIVMNLNQEKVRSRYNKVYLHNIIIDVSIIDNENTMIYSDVIIFHSFVIEKSIDNRKLSDFIMKLGNQIKIHSFLK